MKRTCNNHFICAFRLFKYFTSNSIFDQGRKCKKLSFRRSNTTRKQQRQQKQNV